MRSDRIPRFALNQGRLQSVRDLRKDWDLGIINIPTEILLHAGLDASDPYQEVARKDSVIAWMTQEIAETSVGLQESIGNTHGWLPKLVLKGLAGAAMKTGFSPDDT